MKTILFIDTVCPKPYSPELMEKEGMGGTEATVIRIAEALGADNKVYVAQHGRTHTEFGKATYIPFESLPDGVDAVIALRTPVPLAYALHKYQTRPKYFLWMHDLLANWSELIQSIPLLEETKATILGVSKSHKDHLKDCLVSGTENPERLSLDYVYNPIDEGLKPTKKKVDKNKLIYLSSPHKGLAQVLATFDYVRRNIPELKLYIANPGYLHLEHARYENVVTLGTMPHAKLMEELATSLCLFYPSTQWQTRETFGIVFAEALALNVPTIAHEMGSAKEILGDTLIDCRRPDLVLQKVRDYKEVKRPDLQERASRFRLTEVIQKWLTLLK